MAKKTPAIDYGPIRAALANWATSVSGLVAIWERPDSRRPPLPYIALNFVTPSLQPGGFDELRYDETADEFHTCGQRTAVVSVTTHYCDTDDVESLNMASRLHAALGADEYLAILNAAGLAVWDQGGIIDISAELETGFENRHQIDVTLGLVSDLVTDPGVIETAEIEATINEVTGDVAYNETFIIPE